MTKNIWYDKTNLLSYNALLNFVIGNRGGGKTYCYKKWCIDDFIKNKNQFVWVRRFMTELQNPKDSRQGVLKTFLKDIKHHYPNNKIEIKGMNLYIDDEIGGYFIPLSLSENYKSNAYPEVTKIIYDEFLVSNKSRYLKNECQILLDLIETVQRHRNNVRCICVANAITFANPYFMYFNITPFKNEFLHLKDRSIVVQMYKNDKFINLKKGSKFGQLTANTKYQQYAIDNEFLQDTNKFIEKRPPHTNFLIAIKYESLIIGFWECKKQGKIFASSDYDKYSYKIYAMTTDDHDINYLLVSQLSKNYFIKYLKTAFEYGLLYFENIVIKQKTLEALTFL